MFTTVRLLHLVLIIHRNVYMVKEVWYHVSCEILCFGIFRFILSHVFRLSSYERKNLCIFFIVELNISAPERQMRIARKLTIFPREISKMGQEEEKFASKCWHLEGLTLFLLKIVVKLLISFVKCGIKISFIQAQNVHHQLEIFFSP